MRKLRSRSRPRLIISRGAQHAERDTEPDDASLGHASLGRGLDPDITMAVVAKENLFEKVLCGLVRIITCDQTFGTAEPAAPAEKPSPYPHWNAFQAKCTAEGLNPAAIGTM